MTELLDEAMILVCTTLLGTPVGGLADLPGYGKK
jgi:hypothetical protein